MISKIVILNVQGVTLDTRVNPISEIASQVLESQPDKAHSLYTVDINLSTKTPPPPHCHFFTFLLMPTINQPQTRLEIINNLFTSWLVTTPYVMDQGSDTITASVIQVFNGRQRSGIGLLFSMFLFDRMDLLDDEVIEL